MTPWSFIELGIPSFLLLAYFWIFYLFPCFRNTFAFMTLWRKYLYINLWPYLRLFPWEYMLSGSINLLIGFHNFSLSPTYCCQKNFPKTSITPFIPCSRAPSDFLLPRERERKKTHTSIIFSLGIQVFDGFVPPHFYNPCVLSNQALWDGSAVIQHQLWGFSLFFTLSPFLPVPNQT